MERTPTDRYRVRLLAMLWLLVAVHVVFAWATRSPGISWGEDDAEYVILGKEIQKGSYAERWDVDEPTHARLPPGFPALLSIVNAMFGDNVTAYTLLVLLCSAASLPLFFFAVRRHLGDALALFVTALTAVNAMAVADAGYVMAEAPLRFWATLTLWAASRENPGTRYLVVAAASAVIAALTRSIGVAVIAALGVHWLLERRWKAVVMLGVGALPVVLWFYWTIIAPDPGERSLYLHTVMIGTEETAAGSRASWIALIQRWAGSVVFYSRTLVPTSLAFPGLSRNPLDNFAWAALAVLTIPVGILVVWRRWRLLILVLLFYGAALAVWPWRYGRFVSPVTSMLLVLIGAGILHLLRNKGSRMQHLALAGVASLFVVGSIQQGLPAWVAHLACDRTRPLDSPTCFTEDRRGLLRLAAYAREHTPPDAVFFVPKEGAFYLHSERQTIRETRFQDVPTDSLGSWLRQSGVSYAVITPIGLLHGVNGVAIAKACRQFEKVASFEGDAFLLRVREGGPVDHDDDTCRSVAAWRERVPDRWRLQPR